VYVCGIVVNVNTPALDNVVEVINVSEPPPPVLDPLELAGTNVTAPP
jgi:hypothetical protein